MLPALPGPVGRLLFGLCGVSNVRQGVVEEVLDGSFQGVLAGDFYAAHDHYPGLTQRCWAHLLRDIHDMKVLYPEDVKLARWPVAVHNLYPDARSFSHPQAGQRRLAQLELERSCSYSWPNRMPPRRTTLPRGAYGAW